MSDSIRRVERLSNAACEIATRNRNTSIGPDHLLYVVCSTEHGRREIENRGGDYKLILSFLKNSFLSRAEMSTVPAPDFNPQFQVVISDPLMRYREGKLEEINIEDVLVSLIERHKVCSVTTEAMVRGNLVEESNDEDDDGYEFDQQLAEARERIAIRKAEEGAERTESEQDPGGLPSAAGAEAQSDPHLIAVKRALRNLTGMAQQGLLDPVIGRDDEIDRVVDVLQRRRKGNILLVGEPGVGKTAIAEGVAQLLAHTSTPASVAGRLILEVSLTDLLAGTRFRGDFEQRLRHLINIARSQKAILFIDEAHMLIGAGGNGGGSVDASNILKPAMARGEIQLIAATTSAEARVIRKDKAMMRRFEVLSVKEPSAAAAVEILSQVEEVYAKHHDVQYQPGVAEQCVALSISHMPDRRLPDKALDVMDTAAVEAKNDGSPDVTPAHVLKAVTSMTGVNAGRPTSEELEMVRTFPEKMAASIFGQAKAIDTLSRAVRISQTGISGLGVAGSYMFNGPTGVGKTETAKAMAKALGVPLVRLDMSEFMEPHSVSGLIGAPPGYVGYEDDGALIAAAEAHPRMVLLLDEIEKAHPKVYDILLQVLDEGRLTSADGRTVNMRGAHIVMTANIGMKEAEKSPIGFGRSVDEEEVAGQALAGTFRKELLARIGHTIHFEKLGDEAVQQMVASAIARRLVNLKTRGFDVSVSEEVQALITSEVAPMGATGRVVSSIIDKHLANPVAEFIVENDDAGEMMVTLSDGVVKVSAKLDTKIEAEVEAEVS